MFGDITKSEPVQRHSEDRILYHSIDPTKAHYQKSFESFALAKKEPLSEKLILDWIESEKKNKLSRGNKKPETFVLMLRSLRDYIELNADLKDTQKAKLTKTIDALIKRYKVKPEKEIKRDEILSMDEIKILTEHLESKTAKKGSNHSYPEKYRILSLFIQALYWTGCRVSELVNVTHEDITKAKTGKTVYLRVIGKGRKERSTPILPIKLYNDILSATKNRTGNLFLNSHGKPMDRHNIFTDLRKEGLICLNKKLYPHIFRHSRASHLYAKTKDVKLVQKYLGHSSAKTTLDMYVFMDMEEREKDLL